MKAFQRVLGSRESNSDFNMTTLLKYPIPVSKRLKFDRSQQLSSTTAIACAMNARHTCPCCSRILLRHMRLGGLYWRCDHCREDMPTL
ncbi:MAG: hypothetical protein DCF22_00135 [Leptolyngbya sp.]|nr:MAG: hypothetical protein DCF22_00135 [Leptolyngbya sp.]